MVASGSSQKEKSLPSLLKDAHPQLRMMIRDLSLRRLSDISGYQDIRLLESPSPDDFIYGAHLTVIQLAAKELRLTFKTHFDLDAVQILARRKADAIRTFEQQLKVSNDLFKEYSNLVAGGIAQQLHLNAIVAGISLPLATSGFNEIISSDAPRPHSSSDYWEIHGEGFHFTCSLVAEIFDKTSLDRFTYDNASLDGDSGTIEIL